MGFSKKNIDHIKRNGRYESNTIIRYITQGAPTNGVDGQGGLSVYLDHTEKIFEGDTENKAVIGQTDTVVINAYKGLQKLDTFVDVSTGFTGLIENVLSATVANNGTKDTAMTFAIDGSLYAEKGSIEIPIFIYTNSEEDTSVGNTSEWYEASDNILSYTLNYNWSVTRVGTSAYRLDLSNESMTVNCDSSGNILSGAYMPTCKATLYYGINPCNNASYTIASPSAQHLTGVSIDASGNFIFNANTLSFSGNSIEITVTAKIANDTFGIATTTLSKNIPGKIGEDAVSYWLSLSCDAVHVNPNLTTLVADPSTMTAVVYKQVGAQTPAIDSNCVIKYGYNTTSPTTTYSSAITIDANKSYISFGAYRNNVLVDGIETVPILRDGTNGQSAYRLDLTNENAGINADSSGNILSGAVRPTCTAKLYLGNSPVSGVTYSISTTATGVSINSSSGVFTFGSNFNFSGTSVEITVTAKIGSQTYGTSIMTVSKNIAGINGSNGKDGKDGSTGKDGSAGTDAVTYWLNLSADSVSIDVNNSNSYTPTTIKVTAMKQVGEQTPVKTSDGTIYYAYDNTPTTSSSTVSNDSSISVNITNHNELYVALWVNGVQRDIETVPLLRNGKNGERGTQGTQGAQGYAGLIYRRSVWKTGQVYRNDAAVNSYGERYVDQCFNMDNKLITDSNLKLYQCKVTHTSSNSIPLTNTTYWEEIPISSSFYSANIFTGQLSADLIDVAQIKVTDLADINNLVVQNVYSKNGSFSFDSSGNMTATAGTFAGYVRMPYTFISELSSSSNGYYADNRTNLIADEHSGSYGMGDGGMLILPEPSSSNSGLTYHIIVKPNVATKSAGQNPALSVRSSSSTSCFEIYAYPNSITAGSTYKRLSFFGGRVELTCVPYHNNYGSVSGYRWALISCTGGVNVYTSTSSSGFAGAFSTVHGYSPTDFYYAVTTIQTDSIPSSNKKRDVMYISV